MAPFTQITFERQGAIGYLTLQRPQKRNAQTLEMWQELRQVGQQLLAEPGELAVVVVSGAGGYFSSGIDTSILTSGALLTGSVDGKAIQEAFSWLRAGQFISIAAIEKGAIGAGLELALWCDLRLAAEAAMLSLPEIEYDIIPDLGGCSLLAEICGYNRAMALITTARRLDSKEAYKLGIVNEVVVPEKLQSRVEELAELLARRSLTALRGAKRALRAAIPDPTSSLAVSLDAVTDCFRQIAVVRQPKTRANDIK
jgi:enoyl-CoA hydratase/carnithine racemase